MPESPSLRNQLRADLTDNHGMNSRRPMKHFTDCCQIQKPISTSRSKPRWLPMSDRRNPYHIAHTAENMDCPICDKNIGESSYPNQVCDECDERAVSKDADEPWHGWPEGEEPESEDGIVHMAPDRGENPVFIDGQKCWRRYRFGGWVTMLDKHDCDSLEDFYEAHGMM